RLDVAMDHAHGVRVLEGISHFAHDAERLAHGHAAFAVHPFAKGCALGEGHHVPEQAARLAAVEHGQYVWRLESRGDPDLAMEPLGAQARSDVRVEDLDGDDAIVAEIVGAI